MITGTDLTWVTGVRFGSTPAASYAVISATQVTATSPAGSAGTVDITVTNSAGTSATSAADRFTYYDGPAVSSISPSGGPVAGGTTVTISGTGFTGATAVTFGSTAAASYTVNSATQVTATSPAGSAGTVDITVTNSAGTSATSAADRFTYYEVPFVSVISPSGGPDLGGTTVTISGTGFTGATAVTFGSTVAASYTVDSATQITAMSPAGSAGTVDITVTTPGGTSAPIPGLTSFTYYPVPVIDGISPTTAALSPSLTTVTISGTNLTEVTGVSFGGTPADSFTVVSDNQVTATITWLNSPGTVDITVTTPWGTSATSAADQIAFYPVPTVSGISPSFGPAAGGIDVVITGTGFTGVTGVKFGISPASSYTVDSSTQITATSPAGASLDTVDVIVTTFGGDSSTSAADQFTYS